MNTNKPLLALALAATISTSARPSQAQYTGALGSNYNNAFSATASVMTQGMQNMALMNRSLESSLSARYGGSDGGTERGSRLIKRGRATTAFSPRPFPVEKYADLIGAGDADRRAQFIRDWPEQIAIWRGEAKKRNAKSNDMAHVYALATTIAYEAYTGQRASDAAFRAFADKLRRGMMQGSGFQSRTAQSKQEYFEDAVLRSTDALMNRRRGQAEIARQRATNFIEKFLSGGIETTVQEIARHNSAAPAARIASSPQSVRFTPTSPILPAMLAAKDKPAERAESQKLYAALLKAGRGQMKPLFKASKQDSVAQAMSYAIMVFYTAAKTDSGSPSEAGFTPQALAGLDRQLSTMLGGDAKFRAQSARQKQQMFEGAVLMASMIGVLSGQAQKSGDAQACEQVRQAASGALQNIVGVAPDQIRLSNAGLQF